MAASGPLSRSRNENIEISGIPLSYGDLYEATFLPYQVSFIYSYETSLTYGYLINPMKMSSLWLTKTHVQNAASILKLYTLWNMAQISKCWKFWVLRSKGCKVTSCQSWSSQEKICRFGHSTRIVCNRIRPRFELGQGRIILKVWWQVTLQPFDL